MLGHHSVHLKHSHNIGQDEPYALSQNNSTIVSSIRSCRSRRISIINSQLFDISNSPLQCATSTTYDDVTFDSQYVNSSLS